MVTGMVTSTVQKTVDGVMCVDDSIWEKLTISPPAGFNTYGAQQIKPLLYNACSLFPHVS